MGLQDRDWYQKALSEREKQRKIDDARAKFSMFSRKHLGAKTVSPTKTGFIPMMIFWCVVMGFLYMLMTHYLKPKPLVVSASGDVVIPRARDGHFYALGDVNGKPVNFLVDTGASMVTVSEQFARDAGMSGGVPTVFNTANGDMPGRIVSDIPVTLGPVGVSGVRVGVGFVGHEVGDALLGQSFLAKFEVLLEKDRMTLRKRVQ